MHSTGIRLFFYEIAHKFGFVSKAELESARDEHLEQLNKIRPNCEFYRDVYTEGRGSYRECTSAFSSSYPRANLWR